MINFLVIKFLKFLNIYSVPFWTCIRKNNEKINLYSGINILPEDKGTLYAVKPRSVLCVLKKKEEKRWGRLVKDRNASFPVGVPCLSGFHENTYM